MARKSVKRKTILDNLLNAEGVIRDLTANYHASSITHEDIFVNNSEFSNRCAKIFHESDMITMSDTSADSIPLPIWDLEPTIDVSLLVAPPKNIRCVRFGFVEVIELCMTFGDHIECTHGPAVCLSSTVVNRESFGITEFQYRKENKSRRELHLSASDRRRM